MVINNFTASQLNGYKSCMRVRSMAHSCNTSIASLQQQKKFPRPSPLRWSVVANEESNEQRDLAIVAAFLCLHTSSLLSSAATRRMTHDCPKHEVLPGQSSPRGLPGRADSDVNAAAAVMLLATAASGSYSEDFVTDTPKSNVTREDSSKQEHEDSTNDDIEVTPGHRNEMEEGGAHCKRRKVNDTKLLKVGFLPPRLHGELDEDDDVDTKHHFDARRGIARNDWLVDPPETKRIYPGHDSKRMRPFSNEPSQDTPEQRYLSSHEHTLSALFPMQLHCALSHPSEKAKLALEWLPHGKSWRVLRWEALGDILPDFFPQCHRSIEKFLDMTQLWGFTKITDVSASLKSYADQGSYFHEVSE